MTARLTNNTGSSQLGQAVGVLRVVNVNTGAEVARCATTLTDFDFDGSNWQVTSGNCAISGKAVSVTVGVPVTFRLEWFVSALWANAPWQMRIDPVTAGLGDAAYLTVIDK